jgi:hypothetical protein
VEHRGVTISFKNDVLTLKGVVKRIEKETATADYHHSGNN